MTASVVRLVTSGPADVPLDGGSNAELISVPHVVAVVGKTEGNGCVNDFSRDLSTRAWRDYLGPEVVAIMSGGTEGVLSPHVTLLGDDGVRDPGAGWGLAVGAGATPALEPDQIGRRAQVDAVAAAVRSAATSAGIPASEVHLVLVKCPLLTSEQIQRAASSGVQLVTGDPLASMGASRAASALGVGRGLEEIDDEAVDRALAGDDDVWSAIASTSSGVELSHCEIVVVGNAPDVGGDLRVASVVMADALDIEAVQHLISRIRGEGGDIVQLFAKAEPAPSGEIRGRRHTMSTDSDVSATRHARAAVGGLLAGLLGESAIYVSGGAEHQGPPGGGPVAVVWRTSRDIAPHPPEGHT